MRPAVAKLAFVAETIGQSQNPAPVNLADAHATLVDPLAAAVGQLALAQGLAVRPPDQVNGLQSLLPWFHIWQGLFAMTDQLGSNGLSTATSDSLSSGA